MATRRRRPDEAVEIRLLGPLEIESGGVPASVGGPKPRTLLALLALDVGRVVPVDRIVEDLWPGTPPETATHAVQVYVSQLRKALREAVVRRGPGYVLDVEADSIDVHRFGRLVVEGREELGSGQSAAATDTLRTALGLWRGPALVDFAYEPFAQAEIARLDEQRFGALEDRIEADLALGRHAELVPEVEALVEAQPLRERPRALLMRALYLAGRQADALAAYRAARETLVDELGIEPGPELRELEAAILRQDESLVPVVASARPAVRTRRLAAVLSVAVQEADEVDLEVEDQRLEEVAAAVAASATRHGGVTTRLGDGSVVAVFGVPVAHEDDPLRAARAAVETRQALTSTDTISFAAAIDVGEVVAGDRTVSGPPVRSATRLRLEAGRGDILVSAAAARRLAHAARFEARGEASALVELATAAPAFERRLDTPLIGRKRELSAMREELKLARRDGAARAALVIGPPGVGKSRLATELARRSRGARTISGRCLSYGDGITYWPLREMLEQAGTSPERDSVLAALDADPPPQAAEIALSFRRFCEALASQKPLVLVLDDAHWAEPTLLDLVAHLVEKGTGAILVVCLAREELLEERPGFLDGLANATRVDLGTLQAAEAEALLEELDGAILDHDQRARVLEVAEGNPFFLEQLVALALEGGLVERGLPETVQALLSARLDRLGPGERAVLERGAVVGKEFTTDDVVALLEPIAAPTASAHLTTLRDRGFVIGPGEGLHAFRHGLLQEAVYRAAPKRLRAELHERFADRLDSAYSARPDLDEFVGYHLEQAYVLRTELAEADRRTAQLAEDAGRHLGEAGVRALKRGDMTATVSLLSRAIRLLPADEERRQELLCERGIAQYSLADADGAIASFAEASVSAEKHGHRRVALRAQIEAAYARLITDPEGAADALLAIAAEAIPTLEALDDNRALARAWLLSGYVQGGIHGNHAAWEEAEERALAYYRSIEFPPSTCLQQIAAATYWGPTPVPRGLEKCRELLADETIGIFGRAAIRPFLGGLLAQTGDFTAAREHVADAERIFTELGASSTAIVHCGTVRADVELLAGDLDSAEATLREQCDLLERAHDRAHLSVRSGKLAEVLYRQGRLDEAERWVAVSRENAASDDRSAQLVVGPVEAKLRARRGALGAARVLAEDVVRLADGTDGLNLVAAARLALAEVLSLAGLEEDAERVIAEAIGLYERKGNDVGVAYARQLLGGRARA